MSSSILYDDLGPRGRLYTNIASVIAVLAIAFGLYVAYKRLDANGQLEPELWQQLFEVEILRSMAGGLLNTLKAAAIAMVLAVVIGAFMALGRLAQNRPGRWLSGAYVEFFRAVPLLLMIMFASNWLPQILPAGLRDISAMWYVIVGLVAYNSAMLAELFRAGIRSLDRGQTEAAYSLGLGHGAAMRYVVVPQAFRRMLPGIVSQLIALLKDTSLGFIIAYEELLRRGQIIGQFTGNLLQTLVFVAVVYFVINFALSRVARWLETRQVHRYGSTATVTGGAEDLAATAAAGQAAKTNR